MELDSVLLPSGCCTQSCSRLMDGAFGKPRRAVARPNRKAGFEMNGDTAEFIGNIPVHYDGDLCLYRLCRRHLACQTASVPAAQAGARIAASKDPGGKASPGAATIDQGLVGRG